MTFIKPTSNYRPFSTSTTMTASGATAYDQAWITVSSHTATFSGQAFSTTAAQSVTRTRVFSYLNHTDRVLSGHLYRTSGQTITESSDECICVDNSLKLVLNTASLDTAVSRTNIVRLELT